MIQLKGITRKYVTKGGTVVALDDVSLYLENTGMVFILGKSGSGKSTLLNVIGGLDKFDDGELIIKGKNFATFKNKDFDSYRNTMTGFIFQEYNVLEEFSVAKNISLALELQRKKSLDSEVNKILETVDLVGLGDRKPSTLSGGQKQRVAIARALVKNPEIIMADEPTGALDSSTGEQVFKTLQKLSKDRLVLVVSHDRDFAQRFGTRIIELADGKIISDLSKTEKGTFIESDLQQISETTMSIKQGTVLTESDLPIINSFLASQKTNIFLTNMDGIKESVSSMDQEANIVQFNNTDEESLEKTQYNEDDLTLIRSQLPFKDSFKMGVSGLKVKKIRLAFTIILSMLSFAFFGIADTIGNFQREEITADLIMKEQISTIIMQRYIKEDNRYEGSTKIYLSDLSKMNNLYPNMKFRPFLKSNLSFQIERENGDRQYNNEFASSVMPINNQIMSENNFNIISGNLPVNDNEIAISKFFAEQYLGTKIVSQDFLNGNNWLEEYTKKINSVDDFIGVKIVKDALLYQSYDYEELYTITGIINSGTIEASLLIYDENDYNSQLKAEDIRATSMATKVFYPETHFETLIGLEREIHNKNFSFYYYNDNEIKLDNMYLNSFSVSDEFEDYHILIDDSKQTLNKNEVIVTISDLNIINPEINLREKMEENFENHPLFSTFIEADYADHPYEGLIENLVNGHTEEYDVRFFENYKEALLSNDIIYSFNFKIQTYSGQDLKSGVFEIVGFSFERNNWNRAFKISEETYFDLTGMNMEPEYDYIIGTLNLDNFKEIQNFINQSYKYDDNKARIGISNATIIALDYIYETVVILAKVFLYVGIGFAVFSGLLMLNFITTSISHKVKEIGILRALGATSRDVFRIFFYESLTIALINSILAIGVTFVGAIFINRFLMVELMINARMLFVSIRQVSLIVGISVFTAMISSFFPVMKAARKKPIDSIRNH